MTSSSAPSRNPRVRIFTGARGIPFVINIALTQSLVFLLRPTITYRGLELGLDNFQVGLVGIAFAVLPLILAVPSGSLVDRVGERKILGGASIAMLLTSLVLLTTHNVFWLVVGSALLGLAQLGAVVAQQALVSNQPESVDRNAAFGYYTLWISLGQVFGPLVITWIGGDALIPNTQLLFAIAVVASLPLIVASFLVHGSGTHRDQANVDTTTTMELLRIHGVLRGIVASAFIISAIDIIVIYLPALGHERGYSSGLVGAVIALRSGASMVTRLGLGRLAARFGRPLLMTVSAFVAAAVFFIVAFPVPAWMLVVFGIVAGFGLGVGQPLMMAWVADVAPAGVRGKASGMRLFANRLAIIAIPAAAGWVSGSMGASVVFAGVGLILVVSGSLTVKE